MTNPTAGYSYNICVNDNDFGGACMKRLRFTADMTKEQKRNTVEAALLLGFLLQPRMEKSRYRKQKKNSGSCGRKQQMQPRRGMRRLRTTSGRFTTWISGKKQDWKKCSKKVRF